MADITFTCPLCNQNIQCDELWCGHQLQCPICQGEIVVPQTAPAPVPAAAPSSGALGNSLVAPPTSGSRLAFQQDAQKPATSGRNIPIRNLAPKAAKKKSPLGKILVYTGLLAALGAGVYFGWPMVQQYQAQSNAKRREVEKNSDGGQVGHIANLYEVLDATDPSNPRLDKLQKGSSHATGPRQRPSSVPGAIPVPADGNAAQPAAPDKDQPIVPAVWTLEVDQAKIPDGRVNGSISGAPFVAETARVDAVGPAQALRLFQGTAQSPDREILVYLHLKAGEKLAGQSWTISKDTKPGSAVPQVIKRWKAKAGFAPSLKAFSSGYAMKLELGAVADGAISGKIFIALPDPEQSVAAGSFKAATSLLDAIPGAAPTAVAPAAPAAGTATVAPNSAYNRRYGGR
jgi:hypothetical protein